IKGACVFAIADRMLHNCLLARDCPRVTFYAGPKSSDEDVRRLMRRSGARHVVAIESGWLQKIRECRLHCYRMPAENFRCIDECAGYYISRAGVVPISVRAIDDLLAELASRDVELRIMPSLRLLKEAVGA